MLDFHRYRSALLPSRDDRRTPLLKMPAVLLVVFLVACVGAEPLCSQVSAQAVSPEPIPREPTHSGAESNPGQYSPAGVRSNRSRRKPSAGKAASGKEVEGLPRGVQCERAIAYVQRGERSLLADLYRPTKIDRPLPVVIFIHGGGWKAGSRSGALKQAAWLAGDSFAILSIDYRLLDEAPWPAQIDDCYAAVRWVRQNAAKYSLDRHQVGAWGTSAGAHLAVLLGTRPEPAGESPDTSRPEDGSRIQAVCDWFGPTDLLTMPPNVVGNGRTAAQVAQSNGARLLGATVRDVPERARDASGQHHVTPDDPPMLIVHGEQDPGVPLAQSTGLLDKLRAAGVPAELHIVSGAGHGGPKFQTEEVRSKVRSFFAARLR